MAIQTALAVTAAEFLGGLALLAGFFTRLAALPIAFSMVVAAVTVHLKNGFFLPKGAEFVLVLCTGAVTLALAGPGAYSLDRVLAYKGGSYKANSSSVGGWKMPRYSSMWLSVIARPPLA